MASVAPTKMDKEPDPKSAEGQTTFAFVGVMWMDGFLVLRHSKSFKGVAQADMKSVIVHEKAEQPYSVADSVKAALGLLEDDTKNQPKDAFNQHVQKEARAIYHKFLEDAVDQHALTDGSMREIRIYLTRCEASDDKHLKEEPIQDTFTMANKDGLPFSDKKLEHIPTEWFKNSKLRSSGKRGQWDNPFEKPSKLVLFVSWI